jgi:hypothetical protein
MPYVVEPLNSGGFAINGPDGKPVCVLTRTEDPFAMADRLNESEDRLAVAQMLQAELKAQINAHQATLGRVIPLRLALLQAVPALATPPGPGEKSPRSAVWEGVRLLLADLAAASDSHAKALADPKVLALYRDPVEGEGLTSKDT